MRDLDKLYQQIFSRKRCAVCGSFQCVVAHHLLGRRNEGTRYDIKNALPVCIICHHHIHTGKIKDWNYVSKEQKEYLEQVRFKSLKQYLIERGVTKSDWIKEQREMLKELLDE